MGCRIGSTAARAAAGLRAGVFLVLGAGLCAGPEGVARAADDGKDAERHAKLLKRLEDFEVSGGVRTEQGHVLPEIITVEIRSEICVESRLPGARFWSLDYDTCFVWVSRDTVDARGEYKVSVPCLDADKKYETKDRAGELRLVPRGPVTYLAESDAGWRIQDTFTSARSQRRDLVLELATDRFFVLDDEAPFRERPREDAALLAGYAFGDGVDVLRFHQGWAECLMDGRIGWMEMRFLGTEEEMKERAPFRERSPLRGTDRGGGGASP